MSEIKFKLQKIKNTLKKSKINKILNFKHLTNNFEVKPNH